MPKPKLSKGRLRRATGPYKNLDGRSASGRLLRRTREKLTAQFHGTPTPTQADLIDRAAWLTLYVAQIDAKTVDGAEMVDHDRRAYLAYSNSLSRLLRLLEREAPPAPKPRVRTLEEIMADRSAAA